MEALIGYWKSAGCEGLFLKSFLDRFFTLFHNFMGCLFSDRSDESFFYKLFSICNPFGVVVCGFFAAQASPSGSLPLALRGKLGLLGMKLLAGFFLEGCYISRCLWSHPVLLDGLCDHKGRGWGYLVTRRSSALRALTGGYLSGTLAGAFLWVTYRTSWTGRKTITNAVFL